MFGDLVQRSQERSADRRRATILREARKKIFDG